jgi:predicted aconitase
MVQVVEKHEFDALSKRIDQLEIEHEFLKDLLSNVTWASRDQALKMLGCSKATLWRMDKIGQITSEKAGRKVRYSVLSIRDILKERKIIGWAADRQIIAALNT